MLNQLGGSFDPQGPVAREIADLWWLMLLLGVAVYVLFMALLGLGLFDRPGRTGDPSEADEKQLERRWVVGGGVVLSLVLLIAVLVPTIETMLDVPERAVPGRGRLGQERPPHPGGTSRRAAADIRGCDP